LVEIVIAVAVIGIMAAATVPLIRSTMEKSKRTRADAEINSIRDASVALYSDTQSVPFHVSCLAGDPAVTAAAPAARVDNDLPTDTTVGSANTRILVTVSAAAGAASQSGTAAYTASGLVAAAAGATGLGTRIQDMDDHLRSGV